MSCPARILPVDDNRFVRLTANALPALGRQARADRICQMPSVLMAVRLGDDQTWRMPPSTHNSAPVM